MKNNLLVLTVQMGSGCRCRNPITFLLIQRLLLFDVQQMRSMVAAHIRRKARLWLSKAQRFSNRVSAKSLVSDVWGVLWA